MITILIIPNVPLVQLQVRADSIEHFGGVLALGQARALPLQEVSAQPATVGTAT